MLHVATKSWYIIPLLLETAQLSGSLQRNITRSLLSHMRDPKFLTEDFLSFLLLIFSSLTNVLGAWDTCIVMESDFSLEISMGSLASTWITVGSERKRHRLTKTVMKKVQPDFTNIQALSLVFYDWLSFFGFCLWNFPLFSRMIIKMTHKPV